MWPLVTTARRQGRMIAIPRIIDRANGIMTFDRLPPSPGRTLDAADRDDLLDGIFGIPEARHHDEVAPDDIDLVLVPATAIDGEGNRLGGGAGYYDRWLGKARAFAGAPFALGVVFAAQVLEVGAFPVESHDQPVDAFVTEHGTTSGRDLSSTP